MTWRNPSRATSAIIVLAGLFLVMLIAATSSLIWTTRQADLSASETQATRFVNGASMALNRNLLGVDILLANLEELLDLPNQMTVWIDPAKAQQLMNSSIQQNLLLRNLTLLNAQGQVLATSDPAGTSLVLNLPPGLVDEVLSEPISSLVVGTPAVSFASAEPVLYLARHLALADGSRVIGVAEVPLPLLTSIMIQGADMNGLEVTLERTNGQLLAGAPAHITPQKLSPLSDVQPEGAAVRQPARLSAKPAIVVSRPILYRDLVVAASLPIESVLGHWRTQRNFILAVAALFALLIVITAWGTLSHLDRLARTRRSLTDAKAEVEQLAFYDPLTGLPNRRLLMDRLQQAQSSSQRSGRMGALLFLDLDRFKTLNDTLGHDVGDVLLQQVGLRLTGCVRDCDTVARLGGDEFVVMLENLPTPPALAIAQARRIGQLILERLGAPYQLGPHEHLSTPSVGATMFSAVTVDTHDLLKQADIAMYQVKSLGRNGLCFFDPKMQADISARAQLESDMHVALSEQQFELHYQPQLQIYGHVMGAEVLIRWRHPRRGMVSPGEFIAVAEESELIVTIGRWVLHTACEQLAHWQSDPRLCDLQLSVNVSARQFRQPSFATEVIQVLQSTGAPAHLLKLELTESLVMNNVTSAIDTMAELKARGVHFSVDDFGTGHSSLSYLTRLPLDQIKIDQSFVANIGLQATDDVIVQTIIGMARNLGLEVIAEGVETVAQQEFLALHGCNLYQGYLFGRPTPLADFEALIMAHPTCQND